MTKLLFFSDIHVDAAVAGTPLCGAVDDFMRSVIAAAEKEEVDAVVFCGDAYDPGTLEDVQWQTMLQRWASGFTALNIRQVWIAGNHDVIGKAHMGQPVTTLSPLREAYTFHRFDACVVAEQPRLDQIGEDCLLLTLPYPSPSFRDAYADLLRTIAADVAKKRGTKSLVVAGHLYFDGMVPGSESEMAKGRDANFPLELIASLNPDFIANGHYHRRERITRGGLEIQIVGSPMPFTFGDPVEERGFLIVEV